MSSPQFSSIGVFRWYIQLNRRSESADERGHLKKLFDGVFIIRIVSKPRFDGDSDQLVILLRTRSHKISSLEIIP
jgi:hypothetical protein